MYPFRKQHRYFPLDAGLFFLGSGKVLSISLYSKTISLGPERHDFIKFLKLFILRWTNYPALVVLSGLVLYLQHRAELSTEIITTQNEISNKLLEQARSTVEFWKLCRLLREEGSTIRHQREQYISFAYISVESNPYTVFLLDFAL